MKIKDDNIIEIKNKFVLEHHKINRVDTGLNFFMYHSQTYNTENQMLHALDWYSLNKPEEHHKAYEVSTIVTKEKLLNKHFKMLASHKNEVFATKEYSTLQTMISQYEHYKKYWPKDCTYKMYMPSGKEIFTYKKTIEVEVI